MDLLELWKAHISRYLIARIVLMSSLITLGLTAMQLSSEYRTHVREAETESKMLVESARHSIEEAMLAADKAQLAELVTSLLGSEAISYVKVADRRGEILAVGGHSAKHFMFSSRQPIFHKLGQEQFFIGHLEVQGSLMPIFLQVARSALWIGLANLLKTICVAAFTLWLIHNKVISRILNFASMISSQNLENLEPWLQSYRKQSLARAASYKQPDEISKLESAFEKNTEQLIKVLKEKDQALLLSESANNAKKKFLSAMSHEMRTPLSSIINGSMLIQEQTDSPKIKELSQIIAKSGEDLLQFFNRILDFVSVNDIKLNLALDTIPTQDFLEALRCAHLLKGERKNITVEFTNATPPGFCFKADRFRFTQITETLLENALQFTEHGTVSIKLSANQSEQGTPVIRLEVTDSGPGLDPQSAACAFEPFVQLCDNLGHPNKSIGLGLSVARLLVEKMGGKIWHRNREDGSQGSVFGFQLPYESAKDSQSNETRPAMQIPEAVADLSVLLVEDDPFTQRIMEHMLRHLGVAKITLASNGCEAIESLKCQSADLAFIDVQMPELNGIETSARIATDFKTSRRPLIVLMSAMMTEDIGTLAKGLDLFKIESKPLRPAKLAAILNSAACARRA